jgi:hypothetical protein
MYRIPTAIRPATRGDHPGARGRLRRKLRAGQAWIGQPNLPLHVRTVWEAPLPMELLAISGASDGSCPVHFGTHGSGRGHAKPGAF